MSKIIPHVLGCGCDRCVLPIYGCPFCDAEDVHGQYSCIAPYEWFWGAGGCDCLMECNYCPRCGKRLPNYGLHPASRPIVVTGQAADRSGS